MQLNQNKAEEGKFPAGTNGEADVRFVRYLPIAAPPNRAAHIYL